ncbi:MAG: hypothetical protein LBK06_07505 [Planctomycetaceae bacterium]|jgi:hypothetical protein|nr:hypothetical protein [Planctomycetaceae bacterium]
MVEKYHVIYAEAVLKFAKLNTAAQQREAIVQGRSLLPYRLRYTSFSTNMSSLTGRKNS